MSAFPHDAEPAECDGPACCEEPPPSRLVVDPELGEERDPHGVIAHLGSYWAWADQCGVPFDDTVNSARSLLSRIVDRDGEFRITCRGGILVSRTVV